MTTAVLHACKDVSSGLKRQIVRSCGKHHWQWRVIGRMPPCGRSVKAIARTSQNSGRLIIPLKQKRPNFVQPLKRN